MHGRHPQVSKATQSKRDHAEKILYAVAKKTGHPRLATLATRVRLDNFKKVSEEIDGMVRQYFIKVIRKRTISRAPPKRARIQCIVLYFECFILVKQDETKRKN